MGYTNEMQANVRGKLFSMLGDRGEIAAATAAASSSSSSRTPNKSRVQVGSDTTEPLSIGNTPAHNSIAPEESSFSHLDGVDIGFVDDSAFDYSDENEEQFEWVCGTCTLINEPGSFVCLTCESLRFQ